jgi:hypothetical protein
VVEAAAVQPPAELQAMVVQAVYMVAAVVEAVVPTLAGKGALVVQAVVVLFEFTLGKGN